MNTLHTERLILRPLTPSDSEELFAARGDQDVMAFWDSPPDTTRSETAAIVELLLAEVRLGTAQYWCARLQQDPGFVGICDLSEIRGGETADIGFMILRRFWGMGFGNEIVRRLLAHATSLGLKRILARIHTGNARSRQLLLASGFQLMTPSQKYEIRAGIFRDCELYAAELLSDQPRDLQSQH
jgi:[ribosomal protein S5]-alanine N-acetyltransferase